jgi:uncharacterized membrane protein (UPF0127 family)
VLSVKNLTQNTIIATQVDLAGTFATRAAGLIPRPTLKENEGLLLTRCNSIHMFFMRFAIDAIFFDKDFKVVGLVRHIKPFRLSPLFFRAYYCLEVTCGTIDRSQTKLQDILEVRPQHC